MTGFGAGGSGVATAGWGFVTGGSGLRTPGFGFSGSGFGFWTPGSGLVSGLTFASSGFPGSSGT